MKIISVAFNHIQLELDNGEIIDVNDGTAVGGYGGLLAIKSNGLLAMKCDCSEYNNVRLTFKDVLHTRYEKPLEKHDWKDGR
jgi:hypothetical protein